MREKNDNLPGVLRPAKKPWKSEGENETPSKEQGPEFCSGPDALPAEPAWALPNGVRSAGLTFAVGVGHVEGVLLSPAQEGERGLAIQQS